MSDTAFYALAPPAILLGVATLFFSLLFL